MLVCNILRSGNNFALEKKEKKGLFITSCIVFLNTLYYPLCVWYTSSYLLCMYIYICMLFCMFCLSVNIHISVMMWFSWQQSELHFRIFYFACNTTLLPTLNLFSLKIGINIICYFSLYVYASVWFCNKICTWILLFVCHFSS